MPLQCKCWRSLKGRRRGVSEIVSAIMIFIIIVAVSSTALTVLAQRAGSASNIMLQESQKAKLECLATVKLVDVLRTGDNETYILLYNPSDVPVHITAMIVDDVVHKLNVLMEPRHIVKLSIEPPCGNSSDIYILTREGVLIHVNA